MTETTAPAPLADMQARHVELCDLAARRYDAAIAIGYGQPGYDAAISAARSARRDAKLAALAILRYYGPAAS